MSADSVYEKTLGIGAVISQHLYELHRQHDIVSVHIPRELATYLARESGLTDPKTWLGHPIVLIDTRHLFVTCRSREVPRPIPDAATYERMTYGQ